MNSNAINEFSVIIDIEDPVKRVRAFLDCVGCKSEITHSDETIFTVEDASRAVGAPPEEILKSMLFSAFSANGEEEWVLALMSGANRVHDKKLRRAAGAKKIRMGTADAIMDFSGFSPGGVPPVGYPIRPTAILDEDLFKYKTVWAAAGTDHDFFPISPHELMKITGGEKADIKK